MTAIAEKLSVYINARFIPHLTRINKKLITVVEMLSLTHLTSHILIWRRRGGERIGKYQLHSTYCITTIQWHTYVIQRIQKL
jgi:hypothetical protein